MIKAFTPGYGPAVAEVILPIQRDEFGLDITLAQQPDLLDIQGFYQVGAGGFWLAFDGEAVVGTIGLRDIGNRQLALRKMFVKATHRGQPRSVAADLLNHVVKTARERQVTDIYLGTTERFLAAHRFYEKHGFRHIAEHALPPAFPRMAVDNRFYHLRLVGDAA